jgi:hypothetical protein
MLKKHPEVRGMVLALKFVSRVNQYLHLMHQLRRKALLFICFCMITAAADAQGNALQAVDLRVMQQMEDSMSLTADSMYGAFLPDTRLSYSSRFARQLVKALKVPNSWSYDFPKLSKRIYILYPEDKAFRIFNWDIAPSDITRRYYGAIQMPSENLKLYGLVDYSMEIGKAVEDTVLQGGKWYGCIYYKIRAEEVDGEKVYTLFGLNAGGRLSNKKVLDPLRFTESGPVFGAPIFNVRSEAHPNERVNRFVLEYKKDVQVALNWDAERNNIYFDNLVSQVNDPGRKYTYVASGQVDGFRWNGKQWDYVQNIVTIVPRKDGQAPIGEER